MPTYHSQDTFIQAKAGENFEIALPSNPSTGYMWQVEVQGKPLTFVQSKTAESGNKPLGAATEERFEFHPHQKGDAEIRMTYKREWEQEARQTQVFHVRVEE